MSYSEKIKNLKQSYRDIISKKGDSPEWAVHKYTEPEKLVSCAIPFVGKNYFDNNNIKILVYASAEVLSDYAIGNENGRPWLENDETALNRHRVFFDDISKEKNGFPNIHIQPMNDGALFTAVLYSAIKMKIVPEDICIRDFYEKIAVANYCKYTKESEKQYNYRVNSKAEGEEANEDYTKFSTRVARKYLEESHPYLEAEMSVLQPDYVIIPKTLYETNKNFFDKIAVGAKIIPIYQINAGNINRIISKKYAEKEYELLPIAIKNCYDNLGINKLSGKTKKNYLAVFSYLDDEISNL